MKQSGILVVVGNSITYSEAFSFVGMSVISQRIILKIH